jgi:hypothetical protein
MQTFIENGSNLSGCRAAEYKRFRNLRNGQSFGRFLFSDRDLRCQRGPAHCEGRARTYGRATRSLNGRHNLCSIRPVLPPK